VTGLPGAALLEAVGQALYDHELMGFDVQVRAPEVTGISVVIEFTGDADEADVALAAQNYVHGLGIGGRFAVRELYALLAPLNLATVEIISPERDVQADGAAIITATITAAKAGV
jgi:hypothetical protein